ncbi:uncharacterized protein LOC108050479 [Drosophila rhopaloa]|uniref:Uncharacterized protein LOC108050479 n=1 Tax=Drosophila rhopaloa TaxID=1041015 RepID=A0A6P4FB64_DRORH|nr:uncharacterized protein LOC108050479 [Drosophila rhopaloa]
MASNQLDVQQSEDQPKISTFAVIDLETTNLPEHNYNRVGITELCIYAFEADLIKKGVAQNEEQGQQKVPAPPRVLHKLNLLFQPSMMVQPEAESITGLSNYLLERESKLNGDSAQLIISFLKHLPAPVCLVAHNGWGFDFPILRQAFEKLNMELPHSMTCVDSLRAFFEIDDNLVKEQSLLKVPGNMQELDPNDETEADTQFESINENDSAIKEPKVAKQIDWRVRNETTPKRPILTPMEASVKRKYLFGGDDDEDIKPAKLKTQEFRSRRKLFSGLMCAETKRFPPRGIYRLENLFSRKFQRPASNAHQAEADVDMLMKLIQHYGMDFLAFAEEQAILFHQVRPLGSPVGRKWRAM